jgi:hypothetical protein
VGTSRPRHGQRSHFIPKIYIHPRGQQFQCDGGGLSGLERKAMPESHLAQVGVGVRWGQAGSDFQLQNGLMQFVLLILSSMPGCNPCHRFTQGTLQGLRHRPHRPDCLGADEPSNMQWQTVSEAKATDKWERKVCGNGRRHKPSHHFNGG